MSLGPLSVRWLEAASRDLNAVLAHIALDSETAARKLLLTVDERASLLGAHPLSGETVPADRKCRRIFVGNYVLYYTVEGEVVIRGFVHGARLFRRSWLAKRKRMNE